MISLSPEAGCSSSGRPATFEGLRGALGKHDDFLTLSLRVALTKPLVDTALSSLSASRVPPGVGAGSLVALPSAPVLGVPVLDAEEHVCLQPWRR